MNPRVIEDPYAIRASFHRLLEEAARPVLAFQQNRKPLALIALEEDRLGLQMERVEYEAWRLQPGEKLSLNLEDRGFKFEAVSTCEGHATVEELPCLLVSLPRSMRRSDGHRLVDFAPDFHLGATFSNARNALIDGVVRGLGRDGVELTLRDPRQRPSEHFRPGEESTLDLPLEEGLRLVAPARVAYLDERVVGLRFTDRADGALLGQYRAWLDGQQRLQTQRDRETAERGEGLRQVRRLQPPTLPEARLLVDHDPLILLLTEQEDFAQRLSEGLGRKFGFLALDHIKGAVRPQVKAWGGAEGASWGRLRLVLVHRPRLSTPLELTRQLVAEEACPLPILVAGSGEDLELKQNRAIGAGAVGYLPVEPFRILSVLKQLDDTLRLFA